MSKVSRSSSTTENINTLTFNRIKVYLQLYPGNFDSDENCVMSSDVEFRLYINGRYAQTGHLEKDGSATLLIPNGGKAELDVFGSRYALVTTTQLSPSDTVKGIQQRLRLLGYLHREAGENWDAESDLAVLNFQSDNGLLADGNATDLATCKKIQSEFGE